MRLIILGLLIGQLAFANPSKLPNDKLIVGKQGSTAQKGYEINANAGANNPKIEASNASPNLKLRSNPVTVGVGTATNHDVIIDKGAGASNPRLRWNESAAKLQFSNDGSNFKSIGSGAGGGSGISLIADNNADFEVFSTGFTNWTASNPSTVTQATSGTNLLIGASSAVFNSTAASQTFTSDSIDVATSPIARLAGSNGQAACWFKGSSTDYKIQVWNGTIVLAERTIPALTAPQEIGVTFPIPSSGTIAVRIISGSDAGDLAIDNCFLGSGAQFDLSQAELFGFLKYGTDCSWSRTAATYGDFTSDGSCTIQTSGNVQSVAGLPHFSASLPEGRYEIALSSPLYTNGANTTVSCRLIGSTLGVLNANGSFFPNTSGIGAGISIVSAFDVSSFTAAESFKVQCLAGAGAIDFGGSLVDGGSLTVSIKRFPSGSQRAQRFDTVNIFAALKYPANAERVVSTTSGTLVNLNGSDAAVGRVLEGVAQAPDTANDLAIKVPLDAGNYLISYTGPFEAAGPNQTICNFQLFDGTDAIGSARINSADVATSRGSTAHLIGSKRYNSPQTVTFTVRGVRTSGSGTCAAQVSTVAASGLASQFLVQRLDQPIPAPLIVGGVVSSSQGVERVERAQIDGGGNSVLRQSGSWIGSLTSGGTGIDNIVFAAGHFSQIPTCMCSGLDMSDGQVCGIVPNSTTGIQVRTYTGGGTLQNFNYSLICMGPR